ncbi:MAG: hypothetical protein IPM23_02475 [Candidatus Melainabacteria bacterium]|nr:hypothetical protein [Candidatus Melainabacteria bacterium]
MKNFCLILAVLALCLLCPARVPAADRSLRLSQTSGVLGDQEVSIRADGIRIDDKTTGLVTVSRAPEWRVRVFDTKSRTGCNVPLEKFTGYLPASEYDATGSRWTALPLEKTGTTTVAGLSATTYLTPQSFTDKQQKDFEREFADSRFIRSAQLCIASDFKAPPQVISVLSRFYGLPDKGGIPLQFKYNDLGGYLHVGLITTSRADLPAAIDLESPPGLKEVASASAVFNNSQAMKTKKKVRRPLL